MNITLNSPHGSLSPGLIWENVPRFAVLTGRNGAGKSQLLEAVASSFGMLPNKNSPGRGGTAPLATVDLHGDVLNHGEVFYSTGAWSLPGGGGSDSDQVKRAIYEFMQWSSVSGAPWHVDVLAQRVGRPVEELKDWSPAQVEEHVTPALLWGRSLPAATQNLAFLFLAYRLFEYRGVRKELSAAQIVSEYGEPPWHLLDEAMASAGLPYSVVPPSAPNEYSLLQPETYSLTIFDRDRNCEVPYDGLSSGERVIMSMALWLFSAQALDRPYKLLLLDEPDAHLHPSMTRRFLKTIEEVFVDKRGVRVNHDDTLAVDSGPRSRSQFVRHGESVDAPCSAIHEHEQELKRRRAHGGL